MHPARPRGRGRCLPALEPSGDRLCRSVATALIATLLAACSDAGPSEPDPIPDDLALRAELVVDGLTDPTYLTGAPGDSRLFVVEQRGLVRIVTGGAVSSAPFLDLRDRVSTSGEQGLLSIAFHPAYASNRYLFVNYTGLNGETVVERYRAASADRADPNSAFRILTIPQPYANHNGGQLAFGPDGMLFVGMGDGGSGGDPLGHGQNRGTLLGSMLRIDVDRGSPYAIPAGNPWVGQAGAREEIWAVGLRNPWRFSFDAPTGTLLIADVGQGAVEEVNARPAAEAGVNYGWNRMEGSRCYPSGSSCDRSGLALPVAEYTHELGCSVTGGYVYRGSAVPEVRGHYFYGDYCSGRVWSFRLDAGGVASEAREWPGLAGLGNITSFGQDNAGEVYVVARQGRVYRLSR